MAARKVTTTIDKAGRLVLPKAMRDALHLHAGSSLELEQREDEIVLRPPQPKAQLVKKMGVWVVRSQTPIPYTAQELIEQDREERIQNLMCDAGHDKE